MAAVSYSKHDLAVLLGLLLRVQTSQGDYFGSFADQLKSFYDAYSALSAGAQALDQNRYLKELANIYVGYSQATTQGTKLQGLANTAHTAISGLMQEIVNQNLWTVCGSATPQQLSSIVANLP